MTSDQIRQQFIDFFVQKHGHTFVPSSPVVPLDDPTLLFTNAGMNQFKPIFLGQEKRAYTRAANTQKCIRAGGKHNDLDDVGRSRRHHTFFEMLGNWSFGDYFKQGAIEMAWELLTKVYKLDPKRLHVSCFEGDEKNGIPRDTEAADIWKKVAGLADDHIHYFGKDNFWEMGDTGPCGPCTEIYYDRRPESELHTPSPVNGEDPRVMEIWNNVFIQYNRDATGKLTTLPAQHVDTGMGLERLCQVIQDKQDNFGTDLWTPLFDAISQISNLKYTGKFPKTNAADPVAEAADAGLRHDIAFRVVADHIRCLTFALTDGAVPSNEGRGYVLRRILRRAVRFGRQQLNLREPFLHKLVSVVVESMGKMFPELRKNPTHVIELVKDEEISFGKTLDRGIQLFEEAVVAATGTSEQVREASPKALKAGCRRAVVFDTNAYRDLLRVVFPTGKWTLQTLRAAEQRQSHLVLANPYVIMELGAHLGDQGDPAYDQCRDALVIIAEHCKAGSGQQLYLIADSESLVARSLFNATLPEHVQTTETLSRLALDIASTDRSKSVPARVTEKCREIRDYIDQRERVFVSDMQANVVRTMNPACVDWTPFSKNDPKQRKVLDVVRSEMMLEIIASGFVIKAASQTNQLLSAEEIGRMSKDLLLHAAPSIRLYREILKRLVETGCDISTPERANWLWDMQIAFSIGADLGGDFGTAESLLLVTGDRAVVQSAVAASLSANVQSLAQYLDLLENGARAQLGVSKDRRPAAISGEAAFKLHDTYGFPIDLTRIMAEERGMAVDIAGYEKLMEEAKEKARAGGREENTALATLSPDALAELAKANVKPTDDFPKYSRQAIGAKVMAIWNGDDLGLSPANVLEDEELAIILDRTNFYAEMGGQVGDAGELRTAGGAVFDVQSTRTVGGYVLHVGRIRNGKLRVTDTVSAAVMGGRDRTEKNHTTTHLANWALREVLGDDVQQKGSLVDPEKLRFDFSHGKALADDELARVETLVNESIAKKLPVYAEVAPQEQALKINGLRAVFGEKYPPMVRVVSVGAPVKDLLADPSNPKWRQYSIEFCGGTHLPNVGDAQTFAITAEESVSKGIRRIVALTGEAARQASASAKEIDGFIEQSAAVTDENLATLIASLQKAAGGVIPLRAKRRAQGAIGELQSRYKAYEKTQKSQGGSKLDIPAVSSSLLDSAAPLGAGKLIVGEVPGATAEQVLAVMDSAKKRAGSFGVLLMSVTDGRVNIVSAVSDDFVAKGLKAGDWLRETAKIVGGKGGGRPQMAQGSGSDPSKLPEALQAAREFAIKTVK